jgi:hypothetical protein
MLMNVVKHEGVTIKILKVAETIVFYLKHGVSETGFCLLDLSIGYT